jgi:hypothetical protein
LDTDGLAVVLTELEIVNPRCFLANPAFRAVGRAPFTFIVARLAVNGHTSLAERLSYFTFDLVTYLMSPPQANAACHYQMKVYVTQASGPARPECVETIYLALVFLYTLFDDFLLRRG